MVVPVGIEPTNNQQFLKLSALPICVQDHNLALLIGLKPISASLEDSCLIQLDHRSSLFGGGGEIRTHIDRVKAGYSTIELHPQILGA